MMMILQAFVALFLLVYGLFICWYYIKHRKIRALARKLPVIAPTLPLLGNAYLIIHGLIGMSNILLKLFKEIKFEGIGSFVLWLGPYPIIMLSTPEDIQTVLNSEKALELGPELNFVKYALGNGLITAPVPIWKIKRRYLNPLYNFRNVEFLLPALNKSGRILTSDLSQLVDGEEVDILEDVSTVVLKNSVDLALGPVLKVNIQSDSFKRMKKIIPRITQLSILRIVKIWLWPDFIFQFLYRKELQEIDTSLTNFLNESFQVIEHNSKKSGDAVGEDDCRKDTSAGEQESCTSISLLDTYRLLRDNYPGFTDKDLQHEITSLFVAGANSTKATVCSCLLALAANPKVQEKVHSEIMAVVNSEDSDVTMEEIKAMPYLDQVLNETLRKFMVIPLVTRRLKGDIKLKNFTVPAGATVCVMIMSLHFDPKHYPDPNKFDPDRFTPEEVAKRDRYTFLPFGGGPRNCIGKTFALTAMKILLVHVIRQFEMTTKTDINKLTFIPSISLLSADGYKIKFKHRH